MKSIIVLLSLLAAAAAAQRAPAEPRYDVTSIKPDHDSDARLAFQIEPSGTLSASGITLKRLLMTAFNAQGFRILGGPRWLGASRWDVRATHEGPVSSEQSRLMLRAMLGERFGLRAHEETRQLPVYDLVVERGGSKVRVTKDAGAMPTVHVAAGALELTNATSATFASQLSYAVARPVLDRTRLAGTFDFRVEWTPVPGEDGGPTTAGLPAVVPGPSGATTNGPSLFTALREQLGLRLEPGRGPVAVIVIDRVELPRPD